MSSRIRQFVGRFLLLALVFNAVSPLIAAARDHAGKASVLAFCTADGLKPVSLDAQGKLLPKPALQNPCPFCLLTAMGAALPTMPHAQLPLAPQTVVAAIPPPHILPRAAQQVTAAPRGPPRLV